jgi:hypothetical protein
MHLKKLFLVLSLFLSASAFGQSAGVCRSAYMLITVNKGATASKQDILEALRLIYSRKPDVSVRDTYMKSDELFFVVITQEEIKQKAILPEARESVAEKYRAIPGVEVETCHFRQEVSITGSN